MYIFAFLKIHNPYFEQMLCQIHPTELQSSKAKSLETEAPFLVLTLFNLSFTMNEKIFSPFLDEDVPRSSP